MARFHLYWEKVVIFKLFFFSWETCHFFSIRKVVLTFQKVIIRHLNHYIIFTYKSIVFPFSVIIYIKKENFHGATQYAKVCSKDERFILCHRNASIWQWALIPLILGRNIFSWNYSCSYSWICKHNYRHLLSQYYHLSLDHRQRSGPDFCFARYLSWLKFYVCCGIMGS